MRVRGRGAPGLWSQGGLSWSLALASLEAGSDGLPGKGEGGKKRLEGRSWLERGNDR